MNKSLMKYCIGKDKQALSGGMGDDMHVAFPLWIVILTLFTK